MPNVYFDCPGGHKSSFEGWIRTAHEGEDVFQYVACSHSGCRLVLKVQTMQNGFEVRRLSGEPIPDMPRHEPWREVQNDGPAFDLFHRPIKRR